MPLQRWHQSGLASGQIPIEAQQLANAGQLVVASCKNHDATRRGHITIIRPSEWSEAKLPAKGQEIIVTEECGNPPLRELGCLEEPKRGIAEATARCKKLL